MSRKLCKRCGQIIILGTCECLSSVSGNAFEELKKELAKESLEDLLEQVFNGSYTPGPTEAAIRDKVAKLRKACLEEK